MSIFIRLRSAVNYKIGNFIHRLGYRVVRSDRVPAGNLNLLESAFAVLILTGQKHISVIQVGAFDGLERDPLRRILQNKAVQAILIEPQPEPFRTLKKLYLNNPRIQLENAALADMSGTGTLYVPTKHGASPRASLIAEHRFRFSGSRHHEIPVRLMTLQDLMNKYGWSSFDLLQVDTEGYDLRILQMVFKARVRPRLINLESFHLSREERAELRETLTERGYHFIDWGFDTLAIEGSLLDGLFA